jgi:hypothetical protein
MKSCMVDPNVTADGQSIETVNADGQGMRPRAEVGSARHARNLMGAADVAFVDDAVPGSRRRR